MTGPRILFFTGGTALKALSMELARIDANSVHLVTTFDSGGSTAALRKCFAIPAVGDIRNRLLALADIRRVGDAIPALCNMRLPTGCAESETRAMLRGLASNHAHIWKSIAPESAQILWRGLQYFIKRMPSGFDTRGACLGNLLLAGVYLEHNRNFGPVLGLFNNLLHTRGIVLPIVNASLNLGAILENGNTIIGQHLFKNLPSPVKSLFLTVHEFTEKIRGENPDGCLPAVLPEAAGYINSANVICYPMGSFYSSLLASLLPRGVGSAIARSGGVKIYIPNSGHDSELCGLPVPGQVQRILRYLRRDTPDGANDDFLQYVLVDTVHGVYPGGWSANTERQLDFMGIRVIHKDMVWENMPSRHDPAAVIEAIMSLAAT